MGGGWGSCKTDILCGWCHSSDTFHFSCSGGQCSCIQVDYSCCQNGGTDPSCDPSLQYLQGTAGNDMITFIDGLTNSDDVCVYYNGYGLFQEVANCCCNNPSTCDRVCEPTPVSNVGGSYNGWTHDWDPHSGDLPLGDCVGDCDSDSECASGLKCMENVAPPGCIGYTKNSELDYCYDPMWDNPSISLDAAKTNGYFFKFEHESTDYRPLLFGGAIGILTLIMTFALFMVWRRRCRKKAGMEETQMVQVMDASNVVRVTDDTTVDVTVKEEGTTNHSEVTTKDGSDEQEKEVQMVAMIDHIDDTTSAGKVDELMA